MQYTIITSLLAAPLLALAQFPPPVEYSKILKSPINENITIAYKTPPAGTCTTAFNTQKQFTGYIGMNCGARYITLADLARPTTLHAPADTAELLDQHFLLVHRGKTEP
jgi:hypothetical protein